MFSDKNDFFSVFDCIPENAPENIFQCCAKENRKDGVRRPFDNYFTAKPTPVNLKIFSKKYFTAKKKKEA
jgi:hypothetical protein